MATHEEIFDRIVDLAGQMGKKPSQLATECGLSAQRLFNWRRRGVAVDKVRAVSTALGARMLPHEIRPDLPDIFPVPVDSQLAAEAA